MGMKTSESITSIMPAFVKFQAVVENPPKNKTAVVQTNKGGKYTYKYADLADIINVARKPLADNGLAITQNIIEENGRVKVATIILHESGEWLEFDPVSFKDTEGPRDKGALLTYARKYSLSAALGIAADEDTDAENAHPDPQQKQQHQTQQSPPPVADPPQQQSNSGNPLKRLFAIAKERGISDKALKGLTFYYFNKTSRKDLTEQEVMQFCNILQTASPDQIKADLTAAVQVYQSRKGQMAPLTAEEVDQALGLK